MVVGLPIVSRDTDCWKLCMYKYCNVCLFITDSRTNGLCKFLCARLARLFIFIAYFIFEKKTLLRILYSIHTVCVNCTEGWIAVFRILDVLIRTQIRRSAPLDYGSCSFLHAVTFKMQPKNKFFLPSFFCYHIFYTKGTFKSVFKDNKFLRSHNSVEVEIKVFLVIFWFYWWKIRIQTRNTDRYCSNDRMMQFWRRPHVDVAFAKLLHNKHSQDANHIFRLL